MSGFYPATCQTSHLFSLGCGQHNPQRRDIPFLYRSTHPLGVLSYGKSCIILNVFSKRENVGSQQANHSFTQWLVNPAALVSLGCGQ